MKTDAIKLCIMRCDDYGMGVKDASEQLTALETENAAKDKALDRIRFINEHSIVVLEDHGYTEKLSPVMGGCVEISQICKAALSPPTGKVMRDKPHLNIGKIGHPNHGQRLIPPTDELGEICREALDYIESSLPTGKVLVDLAELEEAVIDKGGGTWLCRACKMPLTEYLRQRTPNHAHAADCWLAALLKDPS